MHFDLQLGPFSREDVCIALVFLRELLTQSKPGEVRMRNVLGRMVASHLVVGAPISRTQVKAFVLCDVLGGVKINPEGHTDESPRCCALCRRAGFTRQLDFNRAVPKFSLIQDDKLNPVGDIRRCGVNHAQPFSPLLRYPFRFHIPGLLFVQSIQRDGRGLDRSVWARRLTSSTHCEGCQHNNGCDERLHGEYLPPRLCSLGSRAHQLAAKMTRIQSPMASFYLRDWRCESTFFKTSCKE